MADHKKKASELKQGDPVRMEIGGETVEATVSTIQTGIRDDPDTIVIDIETPDAGFYRQDLEPDQEVTVMDEAPS